jgi:hypothetical protein
MMPIDRGQYPAFRSDVPERPTQINRLLRVKFGERLFDVSHLYIKAPRVALGKRDF